MKNPSKKQITTQIQEFFQNITQKTPKQIKKIKKLASTKNIPLKQNRQLFCKKCLTPYNNPKTRIKNNHKVVWCQKCQAIQRWKLK